MMLDHATLLEHYKPDQRLLSTVSSFPLCKEDNSLFSFRWNNEKIWVKVHAKTKTEKAHYFQLLLAKLFGLPMLRSMAHASRYQEGSVREANHLLQLADSNVSVPRIIAVTENWLALSSVGENVEGYISRKKMTPEARSEFLLASLKSLCKLHQNGGAHGGPQIRNIMFNEFTQQFAFIDFEEDPKQVMPLADAQARDFLLFLASVLMYGQAGRNLLPRLVECYYTEAPPEAWKSLLKVYRVARWLNHCLGWVLKRLGRDMQRGLQILNAVQEIVRK
ncbi:MAG TPA: hypothetical protein VJB02_05075 [Coxiellaceae bacterium]|nr:hypothetical protein [Coxiellaceae bacterium]